MAARLTKAQRIVPEPCLSGGRCWSPIACHGWGYCRERNKADLGAPTERQVAERRAIAGRAALAEDGGGEP